MKIITFAAIKGGVGKTTLTYNFGEFLAIKENKKVLLVDFDHQCNLSQTYNVTDPEGTVGAIFTENGKVKVHHVAKNIDLLAGSMELDDIQSALETKSRKEERLLLWLTQNRDFLKEKNYDYILIDCHPDFGLATKNAVVVSDYIISPMAPGKYSFSSQWTITARLEALKKELVDYKTLESIVTAKLFFVTNLIRNTNSSKEFLKTIAEEEKAGELICIGNFPEKELINKSTLDSEPISAMEQNKRILSQNRNFFTEINQTFSSIEQSLK